MKGLAIIGHLNRFFFSLISLLGALSCWYFQWVDLFIALIYENAPNWHRPIITLIIIQAQRLNQ